MSDSIYSYSPIIGNEELNTLFDLSWPGHSWRDFQPILKHSLAYVCVRNGAQLIGFINLAWDGGIHAFILDTTVHPDYRRRGIGQALVLQACDKAREADIEWVHVDFEEYLASFYYGCGFQTTAAGVLNLKAN